MRVMMLLVVLLRQRCGAPIGIGLTFFLLPHHTIHSLTSLHFRFGQKIQLVSNPPQCDQIDGLMVIPKWILLPLSGLDEHECDGEVGPPLIKVKRLRVIVNIASDTGRQCFT
jgi:hypothetical protein